MLPRPPASACFLWCYFQCMWRAWGTVLYPHPAHTGKPAMVCPQSSLLRANALSSFNLSSQIFFFSNPLIIFVIPGKNSRKYFDYLIRKEKSFGSKLTVESCVVLMWRQRLQGGDAVGGSCISASRSPPAARVCMHPAAARPAPHSGTGLPSPPDARAHQLWAGSAYT